MIDRNPRNARLLEQVGEKNPFKKLAIGLLADISGGSAKDMEAVWLNPDISDKGKRDKARDLTRKAERARHDRLKPLKEYNAQTEAMQAKVRLPDYDRADHYGARLRREMRDKSYYNMTPLERMGLMSGPGRDQDYLDAVFETKPWLSGIREKAELDVLALAKTERLAELHAPLQAAIAARKSNSDEILMIDNMVRNDLRADSGLQGHDFEAIAKEIQAATEAPKKTTTPEDHKPTTLQSPEFEEIWARFDKMVDASVA